MHSEYSRGSKPLDSQFLSALKRRSFLTATLSSDDSVVTNLEEPLPVQIPISLVKDTQEQEPQTQEFQVGDRVKIVSSRKGSKFDKQFGIVKVSNVVGCVVENLGKTVWLCTNKLVLASEEAPIVAESVQQFATEAITHQFDLLETLEV